MRLSRYGTKGKREDWEHESYQPPQMGSFSFENDFVRQLLYKGFFFFFFLGQMASVVETLMPTKK